jgi:hypothetical protein
MSFLGGGSGNFLLKAYGTLISGKQLTEDHEDVNHIPMVEQLEYKNRIQRRFV